MHGNLWNKRLTTLMAATLALFLVGLFAISVQAASDKYRLVWTGDPATTMTIGWCQVSGTPTGVKYGTDPALTTLYHSNRHYHPKPMTTPFIRKVRPWSATSSN